jgi:hypothetical protein
LKPGWQWQVPLKQKPWLLQVLGQTPETRIERGDECGRGETLTQAAVEVGPSRSTATNAVLAGTVSRATIRAFTL